MIPLSLKLRGSIGIMQGLGIEEIEIDFTKFEPGFIALVGKNGSGKTTIMENLHPFLQLASREGSLAQHFFLRDSFRDFRFLLHGKGYRAYVVIDGVTKKSEAYLYEDNVPLNDGKINTYKAAIEKLLGTPDLFFRSVFSAQNAESITSLTAGKRKELFMELLGFEKYQAYHEYAKSKADGYEREVLKVQTMIDGLSELTDKAEAAKKELETVDAEIRRAEDALANANFTVNNAREEMAMLVVKKAEYETLGNWKNEILARIAELNAEKEKKHKIMTTEMEELNRQALELYTAIERKKKILINKDLCVEKVEEIRVLSERLMKATQENERYSSVMLEYQKEEGKYKTALNMLEAKKNNLEGKWKLAKQKKETALKTAQNNLERLTKTASLIDAVPCAGVSEYASCKLLSEAFEAKAQIEPTQRHIEMVNSETETETIQLDIHAVGIEIASLVKPEKPSIEKPKEDVQKLSYELNDKKSKNWDSLLKEAEQAETEIGALEPQHKRAKESAEQKMNSMLTEMGTYDEKLRTQRELYDGVTKEELNCGYNPKRIGEVEMTISNAATGASRLTSELNQLNGRRGKCESEYESSMSALKSKDEHTEKLKEVNDKQISWRVLQSACSKDGIPALEMDASGVQVSAIANELLTVFGSNYQISFETLRQSSDGKKTIETFEIKVLTSEGEQRIEDLSGGQRVWIETAIQEAIAIYLSRQSGREYLTAYSDESDGALDPDNKENFLKMRRQAFITGRRHFNFIITQTPEIWGQIQQRIHLSSQTGIEVML